MNLFKNFILVLPSIGLLCGLSQPLTAENKKTDDIEKRTAMTDNIKFYPKSYVMSAELKSFFTAVANDKKLQEQLYETKKLSDVASIGNQLGFKITGAEILKAQAGRVLAVLDEQSEDVQRLVSGVKPKTVAQWGRGGGGFLDSAGYWLNELATQNSLSDTEKEINKFLAKANRDPELKKKLMEAKTFNDVAALTQANGFNLTAVDLLSHQAQKILSLSDDEAEKVARG